MNKFEDKLYQQAVIKKFLKELRDSIPQLEKKKYHAELEKNAEKMGESIYINWFEDY